MRAFRVIALIFLYTIFLGCEREGIYDLASHGDSIRVLYSNDGFVTTSWDVLHYDVVFPDAITVPAMPTSLDIRITNISSKDVSLVGTGPATPIIIFFNTVFICFAPGAPLIIPSGASVDYIMSFNPTVIDYYYSTVHIPYLEAGDSQEWIYAFEVSGNGI